MTKEAGSRELVLGILTEVTQQEEYSHIVIRNVLEKYQYLKKQERAFITRAAQGTLERLIFLDYIIDRFSSVKVTKMKPVIRSILRMSVYQLVFMDGVPDAAVCNEAVKLARKKGFHNLAGFVNGVLRSIARSLPDLPCPPEEDGKAFLSVRYSMPEWIVEKWLNAYGRERTEQILKEFLEKRPLSVRVNLQKITPGALKERLEARGIRVRETPYLSYALELSGYDYLGAIPEFGEGLFQVQDVSSMLAVEAAAPEEGAVCMDVCAAPGGKSLHLAEKLRGTGRVEARDLTEYKASLIRENADRLGAGNIHVSVWDARVLREDSVEAADVVLADLPCSGLGVAGRKPDLKYRVTEKQQEELAALQREILKVVQSYVKPGGILVYSTCTINPGENEENVKWFLGGFPFEAVSLNDCLSRELHGETTKAGYLQLLPGIHASDGFFIAKFRKKS